MADTPVLHAATPIETLSPSEVFAALRSAPDGLSQDEAATRLVRHGLNIIRVVKKTSLLLKFLANFVHLMAMLLWAAGAAALVARMPQLAISIWAVNIINGAFSFWQEFKAE
ncbi:MAG: cation-transporting P-type ATPase, partial [Desulfovibrionales bacterium]|nr:cation-transporting P-type ATPase [Desulfovibrionales bacterium]